ncbi:hypothetical protein [Cohnella sp. 56]|uniref:hypothetical protein n=1 Tax=Cohnella sp. 56 TaxID=3113722 RepID=UPI0030E7E7DC
MRAAGGDTRDSTRAERAERTLLRLEWHGYRSFMPRDGVSIAYWGVSIVILLAAAIIFLGDAFSIESVFALGALLVFLIALYMGGGLAMTVWEYRFKEWWICLPVSRQSLVKAKIIAACGMQYVVAGGIWLACVGCGVIRWGSQDDAGVMIGGGSLVAIALSYGLLYAALVLLGVSAGYSLLGMYYGWRRWLLVPWLLIFISPFILFGLLTTIQPEYLAPSRVTAYAFIGVVAAALTYRFCTALVANYGIRDLSRHKPGSLAGLWTRRTSAAQTVGQGKIGTGFAAVYALERSRFKYWTSVKPARIAYAVLLLLAGIGGYFGARDPLELLNALRALLVIPCIIPSVIVMSMMSYEASKRRLEWWLGLPYPREKLLLARFLAIWAFMGRGVGGVLALMAVGVAAGGRGKPSYFTEGAHIGGVAYLLAAYALCGLVVTTLVFAQFYMQRSVLLTWIYAPVSFAIYFLPGLLNRWVVTEELLSSRVGTGYWIGLAAGAALLLASGPLILKATARWIHLSIFNTVETRQRQRGEQSFKFRS